MASNQIKNTVTFSGSDITVVAYRGNKPFAREQLERERRELDQEAADLDTRSYDVRSQIETNNAFQEAANAELQRQIENSLSFDGGRLSPGAGGTDPFIGREGAYQNFKNLEAQGNQLNTQLNSIKDQQQLVKGKQLDNANRIKEIESSNFFTLGSIHTLSYSSFREKTAVRTLGRSRAKAYSRGARTIAGTMVFNLFQEHEFLKLSKELQGNNTLHPDAVMLDQIDPFNLLLVFANEYGAKSVLQLFNIDIQAEGQEMSVDDIITYNTMNFYATDMIPLTDIGNTYNSYSEMIAGATPDVNDKKTSSKDIYRRNTIDIASDLTDEKFLKLLSRSRGLF